MPSRCIAASGRTPCRQPARARSASVSKNAATRGELRAGSSSSVFICARKASPPGSAAHRPADVLARAAHAGALRRTARSGRCRCSQQPAPHVATRGGGGGVPVLQEVRDLAEDPRPALRRAADHHAHRRRSWPAPRCALAGVSMSPLATTGMRSAAFTAATVSYSASPPIALLARAAVHDQHRHAGVLGRARDAHARCARLRTSRCASSASPARRAARRPRPPRRRWPAPAPRPHQRRAGPLVAHLLRRAAHVDVDDLRAARRCCRRAASAIIGRVGAGDLHRDRPRLAVRGRRAAAVFSVAHRSRREVTISLTA